MLLTSRRYINKLENNQEAPYHLHPLAPTASVRLLLDNTIRKIDSKEMQALLNYEIQANHPMNQYFPMLDTEKMTLSNHPFTILLGGHPQAILLAAPMLEHQSLTQLFEQLLESNVMDTLDNEENQSYASLRRSLDITIKTIEKNIPEALELFKLIGLLPGGIKQTEVAKLWGKAKWLPLKYQLMKASMLVYRQPDDVLYLLPFMSNRACEMLDQDKDQKAKLHFKICQFYKDYCVTFLRKMNEGKYDLNEFIQKEANIWACIYRGINRKKDNDDFDHEEDQHTFLRSHTMTAKALSDMDNMSRERSGNNNAITPLLVTTIEEEDDDSSDGREPSSKMITLNLNNQKAEQSDSDSFSGSYSDGENSPIKEKGKSMNIDEVDVMHVKRKMKGCETFRDSPISSLVKASSYVKNTSIQEKNNRFKIEEQLVMVYVSVVIRLCKLSDARKVINEYNEKNELSNKAQAHLYQFKGVLSMLHEERDIEDIKNNFENATTYYKKAHSSLGMLI